MKTRNYLLKKGMSEELVDILAKKYIAKLETNGKVFSVVDLFNTKTEGAEAISFLTK